MYNKFIVNPHINILNISLEKHFIILFHEYAFFNTVLFLNDLIFLNSKDYRVDIVIQFLIVIVYNNYIHNLEINICS
jgi:hypothetical protein